MSILRTLAREFQFLFPLTENGQERFRWFVLTLQAILIPVTASRTSNLLRGIATLFGVQIPQGRYYTFMASVKLPWDALWETLWQAIPSPLVAGRLLLALDDSINPKTGRHIFAPKQRGTVPGPKPLPEPMPSSAPGFLACES